MDPAHQCHGYGELVWAVDSTKAVGTFEVAAEDQPVSVAMRVNQLRMDEPTFVVKLNGVHLARIDINGVHRFDGEKVARRSTHFQSHANGSDAPEVTVDIGADFPRLHRGVNLAYDVQLHQCLRASEGHLNIDFSGVTWSSVPFVGGV